MEDLEKALIHFSWNWELDGDLIRCKMCNRAHHISYRNVLPEHKDNCKSLVQNEQPWEILFDLLNVPKQED